MTTPARGAGGTLGIGVQSVWETAVARSNWKEMKSMSLARLISNKAEPELGRLGQVSTNARFPYVESDFAGGSIGFVACYDDSTVLLLSHLLGTVATTGAGPFSHDTKLASPVPTGLTLEQISGTAGSGLTTVAEVFHGCKFTSGKISLTAGGLLEVEAEVIGRTSGGLVAPGTPVYSTGGNRIKHNQTSGVTLGGSARALNSLTIDIQRGLSRNHEIGTLFTSEPYEDAAEGLVIMIELRCKWQSNAFDTSYLAGTQADLVIPFTGTGSNALTITAHNCQVDSVQRGVNGKGAIEQVIKLRAYADAVDQGLSCAFTNANNLSTAN